VQANVVAESYELTKHLAVWFVQHIEVERHRHKPSTAATHLTLEPGERNDAVKVAVNIVPHEHRLLTCTNVLSWPHPVPSFSQVNKHASITNHPKQWHL
jgi:hypothetical protein